MARADAQRYTIEDDNSAVAVSPTLRPQGISKLNISRKVCEIVKKISKKKKVGCVVSLFESLSHTISTTTPSLLSPYLTQFQPV